MIPRFIAQSLKEVMVDTPAVALLGPRQVGKTTLARTIAASMSSIYLDLESPEDLIKLSYPIQFFRENNKKLIIIDEIQRAPELFMVLRGIIDDNRLMGRTGCQFLLLGSASMDLLRQSSESLAGRISYVDMSGLNIIETGESMARVLWFRGGFPNNYLANDNERALRRIESLIRTYLERDIPQMGFSISSVRLRRLWTMLAHSQGEGVNCNKLAGNLELDHKTVGRYLDILVDLLLVRRLEPWHSNAKKRLIKSPRYYIRDSGIVHRLLGISTYDALGSHPVLGKSWEGFVIENIHSVLSGMAQTFFYSTAAGAEIDLVIQFPNSDVWAIEIKYGLAPKVSKHFGKTCSDIGATHRFVVYGGDDEFPIGHDARVISLPRIMKRLVELQY